MTYGDRKREKYVDIDAALWIDMMISICQNYFLISSIFLVI